MSPITPKPKSKGLDGIREVFGIPARRVMDLAAPMCVDLSRIGYKDEGLRLTFSIGSPYEFNAEVKLSRADAEWLIVRLTAELADLRQANMPKGRR